MDDARNATLAKAKELRRSGEGSEALALLHDALERWPNDLRLSQEQLCASLVFCPEGLTLDLVARHLLKFPTDFYALEVKAMALLSKGAHDDVLAFTDALPLELKRKGRVGSVRVQSLLASGRVDEAVGEYDSLRSGGVDSIELERLRRLIYPPRSVEDLVSHLQRLEEAGANSSTLVRERARWLCEQSDFDSAIALLSDSSAREGLSIQNFRLLASTYVRAGKPECAQILLDGMLKMNPADAWTIRATVWLLFRQGRFIRAAILLVRGAWHIAKRTRPK